MACPGSIRLIATVPEDVRNVTSPHALEGTIAHGLAALCLQNGQEAAEWSDRTLPEKFGGYRIDAGDMPEAVQTYVDYVRTSYREGDTVLIEHKFDLGNMGAPAPMFGTSDCVIYRPAERKLHVIDYKHGRGVAVEAKDNPQLRYYALGAVLSLPADWVVSGVQATIVQPRSPHPEGPIRHDTLDAFDLTEWSAELFAAARRTLEPDAPLAAGDHCKFCPAAGTCATRAKHNMAVVAMQAEADFSGTEIIVPPSADSLTPEQVGKILQQADAVEKWLASVRDRAKADLAAGRPVPGWKLVEGRQGNRAWIDELDAAMALAEAGLGDEEIYERKLISPTTAEKLVGKKGYKALADFVIRKPGAPALAPESDKRPPLALSAADDFNAIA